MNSDRPEQTDRTDDFGDMLADTMADTIKDLDELSGLLTKFADDLSDQSDRLLADRLLAESAIFSSEVDELIKICREYTD